LGTGTKVELAENTDVNVNRDAQGIKIAMNFGTVGFTTNAPLRIDLLPFEVTATDGAAGHVAVMSSKAAGVRAISGKVTVRNLKTAESFILTKGQERLLGLTDGAHSPSLAEMASNVPGPIPAPRRQAPAGRTSSGLAMDAGAWLAVIGGGAVAGIAIWALVKAHNNSDDVDDLQSSINNLNTTVAANQAAAQQAARNASNAAAIATTAAQLQAQQAAVQSLASTAQVALLASGNAGAAAQAAGIAGQAGALQASLVSLQAQAQTLQAQFASGGGSTAQLTALLQQEETLRAQSNTLAANLNNLLAANRTVPGIPQTTVSTVGAPPQASVSIPI
jgi:hypothetical protein